MFFFVSTRCSRETLAAATGGCTALGVVYSLLGGPSLQNDGLLPGSHPDRHRRSPATGSWCRADAHALSTLRCPRDDGNQKGVRSLHLRHGRSLLPSLLPLLLGSPGGGYRQGHKPHMSQLPRASRREASTLKSTKDVGGGSTQRLRICTTSRTHGRDSTPGAFLGFLSTCLRGPRWHTKAKG